MKIFLTIVIAILAMLLLGWLTFSKSETGASIRVETEDIRQDTKRAVESAKTLTKKAVRKGKDAVRTLKGNSENTDGPPRIESEKKPQSSEQLEMETTQSDPREPLRVL